MSPVGLLRDEFLVINRYTNLRLLYFTLVVTSVVRRTTFAMRHQADTAALAYLCEGDLRAKSRSLPSRPATAGLGPSR